MTRLKGIGAWIACALALLAAPSVPQASAQQTTVILVRHAEKAEGAGDVALTDAGRARAARLAELLKHAGISAVLSTPFLRTKDTALPTAQALGIEVTLTAPPAGAAFGQEIAQRIMREYKGRSVLVVGHSNTTPEVIQSLGAPAVPAIADGEYDNLYVVQIEAGGRAHLIRAKY
jgi:broad specificity phosphatase PhoE